MAWLGWLGIPGYWFGWFDTLRGHCPVSARSRALRPGQLGPSEWGTLPCIIKYLIPDLLAHGRFMCDPPIIVSKPDPVYDITHHVHSELWILSIVSLCYYRKSFPHWLFSFLPQADNTIFLIICTSSSGHLVVFTCYELTPCTRRSIKIVGEAFSRQIARYGSSQVG